MAAPERPRRASSAPQRPPGACAVSRPTLPALWCGQPLPPAANSAPCPGSACAFAARAAGGVHSGDSVRAPCSVLAAIAVVLASMRCQLPVRPAGAGLSGQTAPQRRVKGRARGARWRAAARKTGPCPRQRAFPPPDAFVLDSR